MFFVSLDMGRSVLFAEKADDLVSRKVRHVVKASHATQNSIRNTIFLLLTAYCKILSRTHKTSDLENGNVLRFVRLLVNFKPTAV